MPSVNIALSSSLTSAVHVQTDQIISLAIHTHLPFIPLGPSHDVPNGVGHNVSFAF